MRPSSVKADLMLLVAAVIWGSGFVAQRSGMDFMGPMLFNGARFALGALAVVPLVLAAQGTFSRSELVGGTIAGSILFAGSALQQIGVVHTTAGKAGFITGLYVVMVPIIGLTLGHRIAVGHWVGAALAAAGLYFLSVSGPMELATGDLLVLIGAVFWALHVHALGRFAPRTDPMRLAFVQFSTCALLSMLSALATEPISLAALQSGWLPVIYGGVVSVGLGFTLQVMAQREAVPSHTAIILSLEAVFAALFGWLLLSEILSPREMFGCVLMMIGMLTAQLLPHARFRLRRRQTG